MPIKTVSQTLFPWLRDQLGKRCLAGLTGQDAPALLAAGQILSSLSYCDGQARPHVLTAFRSMVFVLQPHVREFAFHAIAHVFDWTDRERIWMEAECPPLDGEPQVCAWEPGGSARG